MPQGCLKIPIILTVEKGQVTGVVKWKKIVEELYREPDCIQDGEMGEEVDHI